RSPGRAPCPSPLSLLRVFQFLADQSGAVLDEFLIFESEGGGEVAVDVQLANDFTMSKDRDDDLGFGFQRTRQIARIFADIIDHDGPATRGSGATDAMIHRDASMGRHRTYERYQREHGRPRLWLDHVKAHPVVFQHLLVEQPAESLHEFTRRGRAPRQFVNVVAKLLHPGSNRHEGMLTHAAGLGSLDVGTAVI